MPQPLHHWQGYKIKHKHLFILTNSVSTRKQARSVLISLINQKYKDIATSNINLSLD
jgi:hypothetical protein